MRRRLRAAQALMSRSIIFAAALTLAAVHIAGSGHAQDSSAARSGPGADAKSIVVASTTSTQDSGLFGHILPLFKAKTGIDVKIISQGTGQAIDTGRRGDADVVFVHAARQEEKFVADGFGVKRFDVMYNDFVLIGPKADTAGIKGGKDVLVGLKTIQAKTAPFVSRGDNSGTHAAELRYWRMAGVGIDAVTGKTGGEGAGQRGGTWYRACGCGMGAALNLAASMNAYVLSDRGTWLSFKNRQGLGIVVEGDTRLFNQYGVMLVNPVRHPHVKKEWSQALIDWLVSTEGQRAIASYKIGGEQLFFPNAKP